jgi:cytochrome P450
MLLIAGQDTTASILVYCYHLLATHPEALQKLRDEHTRVFGQDAASAASATTSLRSSDASRHLSSLRYTLGVIKEALRMYPPGGAIRAGSPTVQISDRTGAMYPTEGCLVSLEHHAIHRNPRVYANPNVFDPGRWLDRNSFLKGAFRPFEHGPRNCIGQDIAYVLLKVALVTTVRATSSIQ